LRRSRGEYFGVEGGGQKNRRLASFSFHFLTNEMKKRGECAQECAQNSVPNEPSQQRRNSFLLPALSAEGGGFERESHEVRAYCETMWNVHARIYTR